MTDPATELYLYTKTTGNLYPARQAIERMLTSAKETGAYDKDVARVMWAGWFRSGANAYFQEIKAAKRFTQDTCADCANQMAQEWETEYDIRKDSDT